MNAAANPPDPHEATARLAQSWPPAGWSEVTVLLAVSGGADSVALLRAMTSIRRQGKGQLCVAHFDHLLRKPESAEDAQFVARLAAEFNLRCVLGRADETAGPADRREESARRARYEFLRATAERLGARYVVTAHTADDQAETVLHHIIRGTGLAGLAGIPRVRPLGSAVTLIRPLLEIRRASLLDYLDLLGQAYRTDPSNAELRYTRNRIRHELLPRLADSYNAKIVDAVCRLASLTSDAQECIEHLAADLADRCGESLAADQLIVDVSILTGVDRHLVRETLVELWRRQHWPRQSMGMTEWDLLSEMVLADTTLTDVADRMLPGGILAGRDRDRLRLTRSG